MAVHIIPVAAVAALLISSGATAATLITVDEEIITGEVVALSDREVSLATPGGTRAVRTEDVTSLSLRPVEARDARPGGVSLCNGDTLRGVVIGGTDDTIRIESPALGPIEVRISDVRTLHFKMPDGNRHSPRKPDEDRKKDELVLANGDTLPGVVVRFAEESLIFDCSLGKVPISFERIRTVKFAPIGKKYKEPGTLLLLVTCTDGSTITGSQARLTQGALSIRSTLGKAFKVPLGRVSAIRCKNGRLVYLSDMEPVEVRETPLFDERPWQYRRDLSVGGRPITLQGRVYRKGLGVHSRCELVYDLDGKFKKFLSEVGIDDEVPGPAEAAGGKVEARVYVDGKLAFQQHVQRQSEPIPVELDVSGARRLTLVVDFGEELHINDHADWADARLIR